MQLNNRTLTKQESDLLLHKIRIHIGLQRSDTEIDAIEGFESGTARQLRRRVLQEEVNAIKTATVEEIYAEYRMHARAAIDQLNTVITDHSSGNQPNSIVGAVRAKMDILKDVIKTGQDFGLVSKKQSITGVIVAGVDLSKASPEEQARLIEGEMTRIENLLNRAGRPILDVTPSAPGK